MMSSAPCTFGGLPLIWAQPCLSYIGAWHAELEASFDGTDPKANADGTYTLSAYGVDFVGTPVLGPRKLSGRVKVKIVGGRGGLCKIVEPRHYAKPAPITVVRDILTDCGEVLSTTVDLSLLSNPIHSWKRTKAPAGRCLTLLLDRIGLIWRVLRDGMIWIGAEDYPASALVFELIDEDWSAGIIEIAPDAPELQPCVTLLDQRIRYVIHDIKSGSLRTSAHLQTPSGLLDKFLAGVRQEVSYSRSYPATVVSQNADLTLQLLPDDAQMRGMGISDVPIRNGEPGFVARVTEGARVMLGFDNGDPSQPYASLWDTSEGSVTNVEFKPGGNGAPVCRVGDRCQGIMPMGLPISGVLSGAPFAGVVTITTPVTVIINSGNAKLLA